MSSPTELTKPTLNFKWIIILVQFLSIIKKHTFKDCILLCKVIIVFDIQLSFSLLVATSANWNYPNGIKEYTISVSNSFI